MALAPRADKRLPGSGLERSEIIMIQSSRFAPTSANHIVGLYLCIFFAASLHFVSCARAQDNVRQPAVAGRFYPADAQQLKSEVEQYVREASTAEIDGEIL